MAFVLKDRVQQIGLANTVNYFDLRTTPSGYQPFSVLGNGNVTWYAATDASGNWEVGKGNYASSGNLLTRALVLSSSNNGSQVTFVSNVTVFCTYPASKSVYVNDSNIVNIGAITDITPAFGYNEKFIVNNGVQAFYYYSNNATTNTLNFNKSRSNTTFGTVLSTDPLGNITFFGALSNNGGQFSPAVYIEAAMDGTPIYDDVNALVQAFPGRISFYNRNGGYDGIDSVKASESLRVSNTSILSIQGTGFYLGAINTATSYASVVTNANGDFNIAADPNNLYSTSRVFTKIDNIERIRTDNVGFTQFSSNLVMVYQGANITKSTTATLTGAELVTGILTTTGTTYTVTLPSGANIEGALTWANNNVCLDFFVINTASGNITINANANTLIGNATIAAITAAQFRIRRTNTNTFTVFRLG